MRYVQLMGLLLALTSCGVYDDLFTTFVTYTDENQKKQLSMPYFFGFNQTPLDSLLNTINEKGMAKYRLVVNNKGQVIRSIELKNTFTIDTQKKIKTLVENLEYLPYLEDKLATTVFTIKRKKIGSKIIDTGLRLKDKDTLKKYGV